MKTAIKRAPSKALTKPEGIINNKPKLHEAMAVGDVAHQGDLCLVRISSLPRSAKTRSDRQLADGSTQGSRHVMTRGEIYNADAGEIIELIHAANGIRIENRSCIGPVFVSPADPAATDLDHPEHGPQGFPPNAVIATVFQRNLDSEQREARVMD